MPDRIPWRRIGVEAVVVVASILLALAGDAWWDGVQERAEERVLLATLHGTLGEDLESVTQARDTMVMVSEKLGFTAQHLLSGDLTSSDTVHQEAMRLLGRFTQVLIRYGPFETLKARGLDLVSNPDLRISLTALYEDELPRLQSTTEIDRLLSRDRVLPFQLQYFVLDADNNWILRGEEGDVREVGSTLAYYRLQTLVRYYLPNFERTIRAMESTLSDIDVVLNNDGR